MDTNVKLSENEMQLVCDSNFILTKNTIISKVVDLFGEVNESYKKQITLHEKLPKEVFIISPKIYRGEKYKMLPYVLLDHPRFFNRENIFAVRSFFWWGNFFSISLILKGKYFDDFSPKILQTKNNDWFFYSGNDIWENDFIEGEYLAKEKLPDDFFKQKKFLKMTKKIPLQQWKMSFDFFEKSFEELLMCLGKN